MKLSEILFEGVRSLEKRSPFIIEEFKKLKTATEIHDYLATHPLEKIGKGSARTVYILSQRFALKVANGHKKSNGEMYIPPRGPAQNEAEHAVWENATELVRKVLPKVWAVGPDDLWIISDLVRSVHIPELDRMLPGFFSSVTDMLRAISDDEYTEDYINTGDKAVDDLLRSCAALVMDLGLDPDEGLDMGKTRDGRLVVLDTGLTVDVAAEHY